MNFKFFLLIILVSFVGCGVKAPPLKHPETIVDSYTRDYTGSDLSAEEIERKKNSTVIPSVVDPKQHPQPAPVKP